MHLPERLTQLLIPIVIIAILAATLLVQVLFLRSAWQQVDHTNQVISAEHELLRLNVDSHRHFNLQQQAQDLLRRVLLPSCHSRLRSYQFGSLQLVRKKPGTSASAFSCL